jgi:hypothetical protein
MQAEGEQLAGIEWQAFAARYVGVPDKVHHDFQAWLWARFTRDTDKLIKL